MHFFKVAQLVVIACVATHVAGVGVTNTTSLAVANPVNIGTVRGPTPGEGDGSTWAWTSGVSACDATEVKSESGNFCGIPFTLLNQPGQFVFNGCGGSLWVDRDNFFYANCMPFSEATQCEIITTTYHCA
ncbi:hypothetical protein C8R43DRAFT_1140120 [Mycena crocata]|nr:hypothetical protein C8R43DRAFT_1140120 [Mycena crocata]